MIGVNVFCLSEKIGQDMDATFKAVRKAGLDAVEMYILPAKKQNRLPACICAEKDYASVVASIQKYGLKVSSAHVFCAVGNILFPMSWVIRAIRKMHDEFGVNTFVFSGMFSDEKGAKIWAKYLNKLAKKVKPFGCYVLYHNHAQEFTKIEVDGKATTAFDYFASLLNDDVYMQVDIGWVGILDDEVKVVQRYKDRIMSIHLKDFVEGTRGDLRNGNMPKECFTAIGNGEIRTAEVLALRDTIPNFKGLIVIDQDYSATDIIEDLRIGYQNVKAML